MAELSFDQLGKGDETVVLCHGFLGSRTIWQPITKSLSKQYQLIIPDLPGHGSTPAMANSHSMEFMAEKILEILKQQKITKAHFVGHSMGGYIGLAYLDLYAERCSSLTLVNSSCYADTPEKKANRLRSVDLVARNRETYIRSLIRGLFPGYYADGNAEVVETAIQIGLHTTVEGVQGALKGMMNRLDRSELFFSSQKINLVSGTEDPVFEWEVLSPLHDHLPDNQQWSYKGGHMSMMEDAQGLENALLSFLNPA